MNLLEGLKRIFIAISGLVVLASGIGGWEHVNQPYGCVHLDAIQWDGSAPQPATDFSKMSDDELLRGLPKVNSRGTPKTFSYEEAFPSRDNPKPVKICLKPMEYWPKKMGYTLGAVVLAATILGIIWCILRWIILGFWPGAVRKP